MNFLQNRREDCLSEVVCNPSWLPVNQKTHHANSMAAAVNIPVELCGGEGLVQKEEHEGRKDEKYRTERK